MLVISLFIYVVYLYIYSCYHHARFLKIIIHFLSVASLSFCNHHVIFIIILYFYHL